MLNTVKKKDEISDSTVIIHNSLNQLTEHLNSIEHELRNLTNDRSENDKEKNEMIC